MTPTILRLYNEYLDASDKSARSMDDAHHARVLRIEADICYQLSREPGGVIVAGNLHFRLFVVVIGQEKRSFSYFRASPQQPVIAPEAGGFAVQWGRRATDVLPVAAPEKPSIRRKQETAQ